MSDALPERSECSQCGRYACLADPHADVRDLDWCDGTYGRTPLCVACRERHLFMWHAA